MTTETQTLEISAKENPTQIRLLAVQTGIEHAPVVPYADLPENHILESLEDLLPHPLHHKSHVDTHEQTGFIEYTKRHTTPFTQLFCGNPSKNPFVRAIFDYNDQNGTPGHQHHTCQYPMPFTTDWQSWIKYNEESMDQLQFAEFLEDQQDNIVEPQGADLLKMVLNMQARTETNFSSAQRLEDGSIQIAYEEGNKGSGMFELPPEFKLAIPVFQGGDAYTITARLRTRLRSGNLSIFYKLVRPQKRIETAYEDALKAIETALETTIIRGN